jgi:hypothetical protein
MNTGMEKFGGMCRLYPHVLTPPELVYGAYVAFTEVPPDQDAAAVVLQNLRERDIQALLDAVGRVLITYDRFSDTDGFRIGTSGIIEASTTAKETANRLVPGQFVLTLHRKLSEIAK